MKPSLYEVNADCCWGDSCEADFWGIIEWDLDHVQPDDPYYYKNFCANCKDKATCSAHKYQTEIETE